MHYVQTIEDVSALVNVDPIKIKWDQKLFEHALKREQQIFDCSKIRKAIYRPFLSNGYTMIKF